MGIALCPLPQSSKQDPVNKPKLSVSIVVEFNRPGFESNLRPRLGSPSECRTSLLVNKIRVLVFIKKINGVS
jgi:hypothetical protein